MARVQLEFSKDGMKELERLKKKGGSTTLVGTIRAALAVYSWFLETVQDDKEILVRDRKSGELEKIKFVLSKAD